MSVCKTLADKIVEEQSLCLRECQAAVSFTECILACLDARVRPLRRRYVEEGCDEKWPL